MKRVSIIITVIITILISVYNVNAKDTLYSVNKYREENLDFIESSYNKNGKKDGLVVAGGYLENSKANDKDKKVEDYQALLVKYDYDGEKKWEFSSEENTVGTINYLTYTYGENGSIDGYLIAMNKYAEPNKASSSANTENQQVLFLKIDLTGELVWKKETKINNCSSIDKIIPTYNENSEYDGYIVIATYETKESKTNATIIKYDKEYNIIWKKDHAAKENQKISYNDVVNIYAANKVIGYAVIEVEENTTEKYVRLIKYDKEGKSQTLIDSLEKYESYYLEETTDGYLLYGLTKEVKVKNGNFSYYLINYDSKNNELWETVGDIPVSDRASLKLLTMKNTAKESEYLLLYQNASDSSAEVIKLDRDGVFESKIKKISNEYYTINNFFSNKDVLYFIGHLSCPEDDSCNYNTNSLFLVSTEDKVIEVEDNDSRKILITAIAVVCLIGIALIFKKKRKLVTKN